MKREYKTPMLREVEIQNRQMLCTSDGKPANYGGEVGSRGFNNGSNGKAWEDEDDDFEDE